MRFIICCVLVLTTSSSISQYYYYGLERARTSRESMAEVRELSKDLSDNRKENYKIAEWAFLQSFESFKSTYLSFDQLMALDSIMDALDADTIKPKSEGINMPKIYPMMAHLKRISATESAEHYNKIAEEYLIIIKQLLNIYACDPRLLKYYLPTETVLLNPRKLVENRRLFIEYIKLNCVRKIIFKPSNK